jgi:hypothetical protein
VTISNRRAPAQRGTLGSPGHAPTLAASPAAALAFGPSAVGRGSVRQECLRRGLDNMLICCYFRGRVTTSRAGDDFQSERAGSARDAAEPGICTHARSVTCSLSWARQAAVPPAPSPPVPRGLHLRGSLGPPWSAGVSPAQLRACRESTVASRRQRAGEIPLLVSFEQRCANEGRRVPPRRTRRARRQAGSSSASSAISAVKRGAQGRPENENGANRGAISVGSGFSAERSDDLGSPSGEEAFGARLPKAHPC